MPILLKTTAPFFQVRCDSEKTARLVVQQINYARNVFEELTQAVIEDTDMDGDHTEL